MSQKFVISNGLTISCSIWIKKISYGVKKDKKYKLLIDIDSNTPCRNKAEISSLFIGDRPFKKKIATQLF